MSHHFEIKKNIPIPALKPKNMCYRIPLDTMDVGDCIELPVFDVPMIKAAAAKMSNLKRYERKTFTKRTLRAEGVVRIWRVA